MAIKNYGEVKEKIRGLLEKYYVATPITSIQTLTDEEIQRNGFVRKQDAEQIRKVAENRFYISFRAAGANTLVRINAGNPCKGHNILNKSVKQTNKPNPGDWSYILSPDDREDFNGLVGHPGNEDKVPPLDGIWALELPATLDKDPKKRKTEDILLPLDTAKPEIGYCYTGDYDMHDLISANGTVVAETVDERAIIDELNRNMLKTDLRRWHCALNDLTYKGVISKNLCPRPKATTVLPGSMLDEVSGNYRKSSYALIRHGSQTNYVDFMLSHQAKMELKKLFKAAAEKNLVLKEKPELREEHPEVKLFPELVEECRLYLTLTDSPVATIDPHIVMFATDGKAYDLVGLEQFYGFFKDKGLLNRIPVYYFFNVLRNKLNESCKSTDISVKKTADADSKTLRECEEYLDRILKLYE